MKQIDICMATDDNYAPYAGVVISSILEHLSEDYNLVVHVLDGGVSAINKSYMEKLKELEEDIERCIQPDRGEGL